MRIIVNLELGNARRVGKFTVGGNGSESTIIIGIGSRRRKNEI